MDVVDAELAGRRRRKNDRRGHRRKQVDVAGGGFRREVLGDFEGDREVESPARIRLVALQIKATDVEISFLADRDRSCRKFEAKSGFPALREAPQNFSGPTSDVNHRFRIEFSDDRLRDDGRASSRALLLTSIVSRRINSVVAE